ncbi:DUF58 domain-containing protein [Cytobacillus sp. S13-E01]|uniref:DUF58 domain-containing protein n=1 Tax=Cytobacillus sp. S13-E01 TaxID=3031326 RepID=UPI0023D7C7A0|nr:DUF58 domain-containing protein [Cytobacillus sp. S13-E01]MDF0725445.1 DUF58 domain-containing protein [Cytobacillus sp. S13-E01]
MEWQKQISLGNELSLLGVISLVILFSGIIGKSFLLLFLGSFFLLFIYINQVYLKRVATHLVVTHDKSLIKLFQGESDQFTLSLSQKGLFPILNASLRITIDNVIEFENSRDIIDGEQIELVIPVSLLSKQTLEVNLPFVGKRRGIAKIRTVEMRIPHLFGFGEVYIKRNVPLTFETIIYTSPVAVGGIEQIIPKNQGDYPIRQSFFEDMSAIVGARNYVATDPFNRIHWKASARTAQGLQTKQYERTALFSWSLFVNVRERKLEELLSGLTYLLEYATKRTISYEIFVNVRRAGKTPFLHIPMGSGKEHLQKVLELVARLSKHSVTIPFHSMVYSVERQNQLSPFVIICGEFEQNEYIVLKSMKKRGIDVYKLTEHDSSTFLTLTSFLERKADFHAG